MTRDPRRRSFDSRLTADDVLERYSDMREEASQFVLSDDEQGTIGLEILEHARQGAFSKSQMENVALFAADHWTAEKKTGDMLIALFRAVTPLQLKIWDNTHLLPLTCNHLNATPGGQCTWEMLPSAVKEKREQWLLKP